MNFIFKISLLLCIASSCKTQKSKIEILSIHVLKDVPSASGIVAHKDDFLLIGDDSPYLFSLDSNFLLLSQLGIYSLDSLKKDRITKRYKPDFEAMELINNNELLVFGSGSLSPQRDVFVHLFLDSSQSTKSYALTDFYNELKDLEVMDGHELNIEAAAWFDNKLCLFNRGRNVVFVFLYSKLIDYFQGENAFPEPQTILYDLPESDGLKAGFSGAVLSPGGTHILFTASLEDTGNSYADGEVGGSYIGRIAINEEGLSEEYEAHLVPFESEALKLESLVVITEKSMNEHELLLVSDSDGGESKVLRCRIKW